jgi:hypothetical protein
MSANYFFVLSSSAAMLHPLRRTLVRSSVCSAGEKMLHPSFLRHNILFFFVILRVVQDLLRIEKDAAPFVPARPVRRASGAA